MAATPTSQAASVTIETKGIFLLTGEITDNLCERTMRFILETNLKNNPDISDIKLIVNSPGGDLNSAFALTDIMDGSKLPIKTYGLGTIASAALVIFMAGDKGHRTITENTSILSHQWSWGGYGKEHELFARTKEFHLTQERMVRHYRKHTGLSVSKICKNLLPQQDMWLSAEEAVEFKIADIITDFKI